MNDISELSMREQQGMHWLRDERGNLKDDGHEWAARAIGAATWLVWEVLKWKRRNKLESLP
jgi:hypothetical protein